jgi:MOSC domain-containing protein YiiM
MKLLSVNVSLPKEVEHERGTVQTGIFKEPVAGRVMLRTLNLDGDGQADLENHGGIHRAVYAYSIENHDYWRRELGRTDLSFGQFGENFTVEGMTEDDVRIGDVFRVGDALIEVTQPRPPCFKLGIKMGIARFPKLFLASGRVGFYLRVLQEGEVGAGDEFVRIDSDPEPMTVREMSRLHFFEPENLEGAKRALRLRALSPGWRGSFEERLAKAGVTDEHDVAP